MREATVLETPQPETPSSSIAPAAETQPKVGSYNEWDLLEEVVVGVVEGARIPEWHVTLDCTMPESSRQFFRSRVGQPFPEELERRAAAELDELVTILEGEGVRVRRPEVPDTLRAFSTPDWESPGGLYAAMPRDVFLMVGEDIIEAPMAWRSRYFETAPYRPLLKEYFERGARWTAAPRPELTDESFHMDWSEPEDGEPARLCLTEFEPLFDAADFARCGRDLFVQRSNTTNDFGIEWMRRHLGDDYRVHVLDVTDDHPMHIDATFVPLAPGKLLINPDRIAKLPAMFDTWDVFEAPRPAGTDHREFSMCSSWISMNVVMIDESRVVVEREEPALVRAFRDWGFTPVEATLRHFNAYGGGFHCCTLDVCRRGTLESYF